MSGLLNSGLNGSSSNLPESGERAYTTTYSAQTGNLLGLHSAHGSFNIPNMAGPYAARNSTANGGPSSGVQQAAGISNGRYTMNNLPAALSQPSPPGSHGHSGITNNGGSGVPQNLGSAGRLINSMGNIVSGGNVGRNLSSGGGLNIPGVGSRLNLTAPQMASMLGNSYSAGGGQLSQNHFQTGNNHLSLLSELNRDHASFDINDFPQLTGQPNSLSGSQGQLGFSRKQGVGFLQQNQEFSMQNEDFPALPGYKGGGGGSEFQSNMHQKEHLNESVISMMQSRHLPVGRSSGFNLGGSYSSHQQQHAQSVNGGGLSFLPANNQDLHFNGSEVRSAGLPATGLRPANLSNAISGVGSYDQLIQQYEHFQKQSQFRSASTFRDQDSKSGQASQGVTDRFGLLGLLSVIRMSNPDLTSLALGIDLMTLGMNLNSSEILHKKFASPWSEEPAKGEPHYSVPECFNSKQLPAPSQALFSRFRQETLFYIFYSMPKDEAQLYAASELHARGWFYHREFRSWFIRVPNLEPLVKTNTYERGCYFCFDPNTWETTRKDNFVIQYEMVEKRPAVSR